MFKSILLAGFFWATANVLPPTPISLPTVTAYSVPAPVLVASVPHPVRLPHAPLAWEIPAPAPDVSPEEAEAAEEEAFVALINAEREQRGLSTLTYDPILVQTARAHSAEMCSLDYFDHHSPSAGLTSPMDRYLSSLKQMGGSQPNYLLVGENIYYCSVFNDIYNVDYAHRALMASPGHRANILEPRFTKVGIGIYHNAKGEFWVTEMFSRDTNP